MYSCLSCSKRISFVCCAAQEYVIWDVVSCVVDLSPDLLLETQFAVHAYHAYVSAACSAQHLVWVSFCKGWALRSVQNLLLRYFCIWMHLNTSFERTEDNFCTQLVTFGHVDVHWDAACLCCDSTGHCQTGSWWYALLKQLHDHDCTWVGR